jgi:hypothetical protein
MPVKRRVGKRREALCEDGEKWLRGERPVDFLSSRTLPNLPPYGLSTAIPKWLYGTTRWGMPRARKEAVN